MRWPAERADANNRNDDKGKRRFSKHCTISTPTAPVAPTTATTGVVRFGCLRELAPELDGLSGLTADMLLPLELSRQTGAIKKGPVGFRRGLFSVSIVLVKRANREETPRGVSSFSSCV